MEIERWKKVTREWESMFEVRSRELLLSVVRLVPSSCEKVEIVLQSPSIGSSPRPSVPAELTRLLRGERVSDEGERLEAVEDAKQAVVEEEEEEGDKS